MSWVFFSPEYKFLLLLRFLPSCYPSATFSIKLDNKGIALTDAISRQKTFPIVAPALNNMLSNPKLARNSKIPWPPARRRQVSPRDAGTPTATWLPSRRRRWRRRRRRWRSRRTCPRGSREEDRRGRWARKTSRTRGSRGADQREAQRLEAHAGTRICSPKDWRKCPILKYTYGKVLRSNGFYTWLHI